MKAQGTLSGLQQIYRVDPTDQIQVEIKLGFFVSDPNVRSAWGQGGCKLLPDVIKVVYICELRYTVGDYNRDDARG